MDRGAACNRVQERKGGGAPTTSDPGEASPFNSLEWADTGALMAAKNQQGALSTTRASVQRIAEIPRLHVMLLRMGMDMHVSF